MIGNILSRHWLSKGHTVIGISRRPEYARNLLPTEISVIDWGALTPELFQVRPIYCVVNVSGAPMMQRWNRKSKPEILNSRETAIRNINKVVRALAPSQRPKCIINASSVAVYSTQRKTVDESIEPNLDVNFFQSLVWKRLEKTICELNIPDVRTVVARIGLVIGPYALMQSLFAASRFYLGAVLGNGKQKISWISHHDLARIFDLLMTNQSASGIYNVVSPQSVSAEAFSSDIAASQNRPIFLKIPEPFLRLLLGELAQNFLTSASVAPRRLEQLDFAWNLPDFRSAVRQVQWQLSARNLH